MESEVLDATLSFTPKHTGPCCEDQSCRILGDHLKATGDPQLHVGMTVS